MWPREWNIQGKIVKCGLVHLRFIIACTSISIRAPMIGRVLLCYFAEGNSERVVSQRGIEGFLFVILLREKAIH